MYLFKAYTLILIYVIVALYACQKEDAYQPFVRTEDILYVSGEQIIISGRIIAPGAVNVREHGFQISENEDFGNVQSISLGSRDVPGRFIGTYELLKYQTHYFIRSFADLGGEMLVGNTLPFTTLTPAINDFSPLFGIEGHTISLTGSNLGMNTEVYFGDQKGEVVDILYESIILVKVPAIGSQSKVPIKIISQGDELIYADSFEYIIGIWSTLSEFSLEPEKAFQETFQIESENSVLFGLGTPLLGTDLNPKIWQVDKSTNLVFRQDIY